MTRPKLLLISHVLPFSGSSGQQQRVFYTLKAAQPWFDVTFLTIVPAGESSTDIAAQLFSLCHKTIILPCRYHASRLSRIRHRLMGLLFCLGTGLKFSNYVIGQLEFSLNRLTSILNSHHYDCVLFEYWHAAAVVPRFHAHQMLCILDMHDILWQTYSIYLDRLKWLPTMWKRWALRSYRQAEENAWNNFAAIVAINREEEEYVRTRVASTTKLFHTPMGIDLSRWPYGWEPSSPPRIGFYGGLGSQANQEAALRTYHAVMPGIWQQFPTAELWLIGANPGSRIRELTADTRVRVTGYVEEVGEVLKTLSVLVCPWTGTFGFRSRLIEVMALGVPVVATPDAVVGMDLESGKGLLLGEDDEKLASLCQRLLSDVEFARSQSLAARQQIETKFSFENTYGRWMAELSTWLRERKNLS